MFKRAFIAATTIAALTLGITSTATATPQQTGTSAHAITASAHTAALATAKKSVTVKKTTTANLHMRASATTKSRSVTVIPKGKTVTVTGKAKGKWHPVSYNGKKGWASGTYLKPAKTVTSKPATSSTAKKPASTPTSSTPNLTINSFTNATVSAGKSKSYTPTYKYTGSVKVNSKLISAYNSRGQKVAASFGSIHLSPGRYTIKATVTYQPKTGSTWGKARTASKTSTVTVSQPTAKWMAPHRAHLDKLGGKSIPLIEFNGWCSGVKVSGCANTDGYIMINKSLDSLSKSRQQWVVTHEYAHQKQFAVWSKLNKSATYKRLFGSNPEFLANCMASQRGYTNHGDNKRCTKERLTYSANVWKGVVKN